jgi:hypothetical protein
VKKLSPSEIAAFARDVLLNPARTRPVVALTTNARTGRPFVDPAEVERRLGAMADLVEIETGDLGVTDALPERRVPGRPTPGATGNRRPALSPATEVPAHLRQRAASGSLAASTSPAAAVLAAQIWTSYLRSRPPGATFLRGASASICWPLLSFLPGVFGGNAIASSAFCGGM